MRESRGGDLVFTYSMYEVAPPGLQAQAPRTPVRQVLASELTVDWLVHRLRELGPAQELAWHSRVEYKGAAFHIPMIDFVDRPANFELRALSRVLTAEMNADCQFAFFQTGRSLHGYLPEIIPEDVWPKHLGRLLTMNQSDGPPVIDTRWIGHALVRGFAALRWSHNTTRYLQIPRLVSVLEG
ncbi:MAG: hypothetical protein ACREIM_10735, partial [Nitrospiraceae bacterium]